MRKSFNGVSINKEKIQRLLKGQAKDANWFNSMLEGYLYNQDPVVGGLALHVKKQLDKTMIEFQMRHTKFMERIPSSISNLRVVEVEGIDLCPCAGTHVENTSSIPNIEFVSKKNKGKGRIRFSDTFVK